MFGQAADRQNAAGINRKSGVDLQQSWICVSRDVSSGEATERTLARKQLYPSVFKREAGNDF
jgi:hypothetical protein